MAKKSDKKSKKEPVNEAPRWSNAQWAFFGVVVTAIAGLIIAAINNGWFVILRPSTPLPLPTEILVVKEGNDCFDAKGGGITINGNVDCSTSRESKDDPTPTPITSVPQWGNGGWTTYDGEIVIETNGTAVFQFKDTGETSVPSQHEYTFLSSADWTLYTKCDLHVDYSQTGDGVNELNYSLVTGEDWDWWTIKNEVLLNSSVSTIPIFLDRPQWFSGSQAGNRIKDLDNVYGIAFYFDSTVQSQLVLKNITCN